MQQTTNFQPLCIDDVQVTHSVFDLAYLSPSFSPTPTKTQPPDGNILHEELMEFRRVLAWKAHFRLKDFKASSSLEDFVNMEFSKFQKQPWYEKSNKTPPPLPYPLENAFHNVYTSIMQPRIVTNKIQILTQTRRKLSASQDVSQVRVLVYIAKTNPPESALLLWLIQIRRLKIFFLMVLNTRNWTQTIPPFTNPKLLIGTENTSLPSNPFKKILANFLFQKMFPLPTSKF